MPGPTHSESIREARALQRAAGADDPISLAEARNRAQAARTEKTEKEITDGFIQAAFARLETRIAELEKQLLGLRITGPGHSGEGTRLMFTPEQDGGSGDGSGVTADRDWFDGTTGTLRVAHYVNGIYVSDD